MADSRVVRFWLLLAVVVFGPIGCTLPRQELGAYSEAMSAAREAGELILLDHSAARVTFQKIKESRIVGSTARQAEEVRLAFDAEKIAAQPLDVVLARIHAWEVLSRYSDALVALAEGRSPEEVEGTVDALLKAVSALSVEAAAEVAPFAGLIKIGIAQMQQAIEARKFREAVAAADGLIDELAAMLIQDANDFYAVRLGIRNLEYSQCTDKIADARARLVQLLGSHSLAVEDGDDLAQSIKGRFDATIMRLPDWKEDHLLEVPDPGTGPNTPLSTSVIEAELTDIDRWVTEAVRVDSALLEYRNALSSYVLLVHHMRASHAVLAAATKKTASSLPPPTGIMRTVIAVRRSISAYRELK